MRSRLSLFAAALAIAVWPAGPAAAASFFFSTGNADGRLAAASRPASAGKVETETADDLILTQTTAIARATVTGLIPVGAPLSSIRSVEIEVYRVFPLDSDTNRTPNVTTRMNSPADVEIDGATRSDTSGTLDFVAHILSASFTAANSVVNGINKKPNQATHGEGPVTGEEVEITINFTTPIILPAGHYFFRPEVLVMGGDFLYLSAPKPILPPGTPFNPDLQAWIRNSNLTPDWSRIGTDIIDDATPPTFNMTFSLTGNTVPEAGAPGRPNCHGVTVSALAEQFGGFAAASLGLGASSVDALQDAIRLFCEP